MDPIFETEKQRLTWTVQKFLEILEDSRLQYASLPALYRNDPDLLGDLMLQVHNRIALLERSQQKPYFARIDFTEHAATEPQRCYIGKIGVSDGDNRIVTVDWRAPISTLYYDSNVGPVQYQAPGGLIAGTLDLKRQLEIESGNLLSCSDVDTVSNDEILKPYLGVSADNRLKNIVASIQTEQNQIIREKLSKNIVVQGAAGSGKTTVALHRIAYLVYNNRETIRPQQYMVIGPNTFFISYISSVLPDLDVDSVPQHTYATLTQEFLDETFTLTDSSVMLTQVIEDDFHSPAERFKTSMCYKQALDRFLDDFSEHLLPQGDMTLKDFVLIPQNVLVQAWEDARPQALSNSRATLLSRVEKCILLLTGYISNQRDLLEAKLSLFFKNLYSDASSQKDLSRMHKDRQLIEDELERGCRRTLQNFFKGINVKVLALYRTFLQGCTDYIPDYPVPGQLEAFKKQSLSLLRAKRLTPEDLPAVLYLAVKLRGAPRYQKYRHVVVDEAQDYGEFDLYALQCLLSASTFTVVGDLAQSIYGYRSMENWDVALKESFFAEAQLFQMKKSYRTTVEIMEAANFVVQALGLEAAQPVIRHGEPVEMTGLRREEIASAVYARILAYQAAGLASIAVLCKTAQHTAQMGEALLALGLVVNCITGDAQRYDGGLCVMAGYQSKGLEFDGVILCDASQDVYSAARPVDMHLLYVAMTRPLHRLTVFYTAALTAPLEQWRLSVPSSL